jgi:hypothetical protein
MTRGGNGLVMGADKMIRINPDSIFERSKKLKPIIINFNAED